MQQLNEYLNELKISRGASGASDSGLPDDEMIDSAGYETEVNFDDDTIIADAKLLAERYLTYEGPYSYEDFWSFREKMSIFEFGMPYQGLFETPDCFYFDCDCARDCTEKQRWFLNLFWSQMDDFYDEDYKDEHARFYPLSLYKYHPYETKRGYEHCSRCGEDVAPMEFFDRGMCADCNEQVYGVNIDNCVVCCDVNYIGREGRCIICDMEYDMDEPMDEDQCASCSSTLDEEGYCDGCGWSR